MLASTQVGVGPGFVQTCLVVFAKTPTEKKEKKRNAEVLL